MRQIGTKFLPVVFVVVVLTAILSFSSVRTIQSLLDTAEHNNAALHDAANARAELNELQMLDMRNRNGFTVDRANVDNTLISLENHTKNALTVLPASDQSRTTQILEQYLGLAAPEVALAPGSVQANSVQAMYQLLLERLDEVEAIASSEATNATNNARNGTALAAVLSLASLAFLMLYVIRLSRRRFESAITDQYTERFEAIATESEDFLLVVEEGGELSYTSPAIHRVLGNDELENVSEILDMMSADHRALVEGAIADPQLVSEPVIFPVRTPDGTVHQIEMMMRDHRENPAVGALVVSGRDVTAQVDLQKKLTEQANSDSLTGLPNRRALNRALAETLARSERKGEEAAFLLLDLDGFKGVNDTLGHPVGDALLIEVAERLRSGTRQGEVVGRLGGDEFAVIFEGISSPQAAKKAANRLASLLKAPYEVEGQLLSLGVSGGLGIARGRSDQDELIRRADIALYEAKNRGRGRIEVFLPEMEELLVGQVRLQREIESGFRNEEFSLVYQPLLTIDGNTPVGFEALMRWESPVLGVITPLTFIPVCERSGMIVDLGRWALQEACRQLAIWQAERNDPDLSMSVNVSVVQLADPDFMTDLENVLDITGIKPTSLQLEVTESVLADRVEELIVRLQEIRSLGVRVALDDFGTGYSSMGQLQSLPVDCIKIDRSFIEALNEDGDQAALVVNALVELGRALGLQVIAEGVEELEQLSALVGPQCDLAQGFLLARPMNPDDVAGYMAGFPSQQQLAG